MRISDWSSDVCSSDLAVRLEAGEDARRLIPYLDRLQLIEVSFPRFRDGRGFSSARILREAGYKGELRAEGDVLIDLLFFMRRSGFARFALQPSLNPPDVESAPTRPSTVHKHPTDTPCTHWSLRPVPPARPH